MEEKHFSYCVCVEKWAKANSVGTWEVYTFEFLCDAIDKFGESMAGFCVEQAAVVMVEDNGSYTVIRHAKLLCTWDDVGLCTSAASLHVLQNEVNSALGINNESEVSK